MLRFPSVNRSKSGAAKRRLSALLTKYVGKEYASIKDKVETEDSQRYILNWKEFMCFAFVWETCLFQIVHYIDMNLQYGGLIVFLIYLMFGLTMGMPLYAALLFWGSYTRKGYIQFWEMIPLLKGMTWAVSLFCIFYEFFNVSLASLALTYLPGILQGKIPWSECQFEEASNSCVPMCYKESYNGLFYSNNFTNNSICEKIHFAAYEFFMYNKIRSPYNLTDSRTIGEFQKPWLISVFCTWFLIFLLQLLGFKRFRTVISTIAFIFATVFFIPTFLITISVSRNFATPVPVRGSPSHLTNVKLWLSILSHSLSRKVPGLYTILGSHAPKNLKSNEHIFYIYGMKYVCFLFLTVWLSTSLKLLKLYYNAASTTCFPASGLILMFAIIPDILTQFPLSQMLLFLYFLGLWYFGFLSALYTITAFLESITEVMPGILGLKLCFCAILCATCFLLNSLFLTNLYLWIIEVWKENTFTVLSAVLTFIFSLAIYIYSVQKYGDDFYFVHGKPLGRFWKESLKLLILISTFFLYIIITTEITTGYTTAIIDICADVFIVVALLPIVFVAIFVYTKYKNKHKPILAITPTSKWGPPTLEKMQARNRFKPQKESRYNREDQKCRHNCLLQSEKLKQEIHLLKMKQLCLTTAFDLDDIQ